ncbi:MAG: hypothetical protein ACI4KF_10150 [Huintestinicola sp.]
MSDSSKKISAAMNGLSAEKAKERHNQDMAVLSLIKSDLHDL